jgi:DNA-binding transcriptional ArsR family regulator
MPQDRRVRTNPLHLSETVLTIYNQMVVDRLTETEVDLLFHALADRTRRDIVARTFRGEQSVSALAEHYTMSFAAVQKHVAVLERASLVTKERRGRQQIVRGNVGTIRLAAHLIKTFEEIWSLRSERMEAILAEPIAAAAQQEAPPK